MRTNTLLLKAFLDKNSSEEHLIANAQQLHPLVENPDFWGNIVRDRTYSAAHRRIAIVQYFIRHCFYRKAGLLGLDSLNLLPSEWKAEVMRLIAGVIPVDSPIGDALIRIYFTFGEMDAACVYLSIFPNTEDSELIQIVSGIKTDSCQVITDVAAGEHLQSGADITWNRWQRRQVYEYHKPRRKE